MKVFESFQEYVNEGDILQKAMDILYDNGIDDFPGGDYDEDDNPYLEFDSKDDAKKALKHLGKMGKIDSKNPRIINLYESTINESREVEQLMQKISYLSADEMEILFMKISKYFADNEDVLDNMDAKGISKSFQDAHNIIKKRKSN